MLRSAIVLHRIREACILDNLLFEDWLAFRARIVPIGAAERGAGRSPARNRSHVWITV